jgi:phage gpG-like protein
MAENYCVLDDAESQKWLKALREKIKKVEGAADVFAGVLASVVFQDVNAHFKNEEGPDGPWKPWSDAYAEHMKEIGKGGNNLLQDTGRLRNSFFPSNYRRVSNGFIWYNPARVGKFPYAYAHNEGGPKLPKRSFMWLSEETKEKIASLTLQFILED